MRPMDAAYKSIVPDGSPVIRATTPSCFAHGTAVQSPVLEVEGEG
jgi:hypothetical protein